jgi:hypothetical protein
MKRGAREPWDALFCKRSPLFWPIERAAAALTDNDQWPAVADYASLGAREVRFVRAEPRPRGARRRRAAERPGYDASIVLEGVVPTRPHNWHDLYNALVWSVFPQAKLQLHRRQRELSSPQGGLLEPGRRCPEHDVLAMLDEGGVLVLTVALREMEVRRALRSEDAGFLGRCEEAGEVCRIVFGHAIYEQLRTGGGSIWAMSLVLVASELPLQPEQRCRLADRLLLAELEQEIRSKECYPRVAVPW